MGRLRKGKEKRARRRKREKGGCGNKRNEKKHRVK
jgi:hypothetical protein